MKNRKCADKAGVILEMIKYGPGLLQDHLLQLHNEMIIQGHVSSSWRRTIFKLISKKADLTDPLNYRPTAILNVFYKIFSRMLYENLHDTLERFQTDAQTGFR